MTGNPDFSPEHTYPFDEEGRRQHRSIHDFAVSEMTSNLQALAEVQPEARLSSDEMVGYQYIQTGIGSLVIAEAIRSTTNTTSMMLNYDRNPLLKSLLDRFIGRPSVPARTDRLVLGFEGRLKADEFPPEVSEFTEFRSEGVPGRYEYTTLRPKPGMEFYYEGRQSTDKGMKPFTRGILDKETEYIDFIDVRFMGERAVMLALTSRETRSILNPPILAVETVEVASEE